MKRLFRNLYIILVSPIVLLFAISLAITVIFLMLGTLLMTFSIKETLDT